MKQTELINFLVENFKSIHGVKALYLKGSLARDEADVFSDVDFYCLTDKETYNDILKQRDTILAKYNPIYFIEEVNFGLEQIVILYSNNLHLDFYITSDVPQSGTDDIKPLYDPTHLLKDYIRNKRTTSSDDLVKSINNSIYTLSEIHAAINRNDDLWSIRLMSHVLADLTTPLCYLFNKDKPVVHMKGLYCKLPQKTRNNVDIILQLMTPATQRDCVFQIIDLLEDVIKLFDTDIKDKLFINYLNLMKDTFESEQS